MALTVLGHLKRGFFEKGYQVRVQTEYAFLIRVAKLMRIPEIIG